MDQSTVVMSLAMHGAMDIYTPGTGTPLFDIAMNLGGVNVVVEKTNARGNGSQIGIVPGDVLRTTLVTEVL